MDTSPRSLLANIGWFDISYIGDWVVMTGVWFLASFVDALPPFEREFSLDDPLISHSHTKQQIGGTTNNLLSFGIPLVIVVGFSILQASSSSVHHNILGLWTARSSSRLITEFLKNRIGRLRPDFLARCAWDDLVEQCTGKPEDVRDGRRSFPSGHSSTAFSGMTFLFLWVCSQTAAWSLSRPLPNSKTYMALLNSRSLRIVLSLAPLSFATWIAISRVEDYRHHKEDVIAGSLIGIFCGSLGYLIYWPNPLAGNNWIEELVREPRNIYGVRQVSTAQSSADYQLASMEDGREHL